MAAFYLEDYGTRFPSTLEINLYLLASREQTPRTCVSALTMDFVPRLADCYCSKRCQRLLCNCSWQWFGFEFEKFLDSPSGCIGTVCFYLMDVRLLG